MLSDYSIMKPVEQWNSLDWRAVQEIGMVKDGTDGREKKLVEESVSGIVTSIMQKISRLKNIGSVSQTLMILSNHLFLPSLDSHFPEHPYSFHSPCSPYLAIPPYPSHYF